MHWYKLAKLQKESLNMNDLYDFYLIASISKEKMVYVFDQDLEKKFYLTEKLDNIKKEYVKGGKFAINLELRHGHTKEIAEIIKVFVVREDEDLLKAADIFERNVLDGEDVVWPDGKYAGNAWVTIAKLIYDLSQFPDLIDYAMKKNSNNKFLVDQIYKLIFKIDHINDICHNTGIALPKMMDEYYNEFRDGVVPVLENPQEEVEFLDKKRELKYTVQDFLNYKKENDVKNLVNKTNIDLDLLSFLDYGAAVPDFHNAYRLFNKWEEGIIDLSYKDFYNIFWSFFDNNFSLMHVFLRNEKIDKNTKTKILIDGMNDPTVDMFWDKRVNLIKTIKKLQNIFQDKTNLILISILKDFVEFLVNIDDSQYFWHNLKEILILNEWPYDFVCPDDIATQIMNSVEFNLKKDKDKESVSHHIWELIERCDKHRTIFSDNHENIMKYLILDYVLYKLDSQKIRDCYFIDFVERYGNESQKKRLEEILKD